MRDTIELVTSPGPASRYRALLTEEWDRVLEEALPSAGELQEMLDDVYAERRQAPA
jgi:hypothetical protein